MPTRHTQRAILPARAALLVSWAMLSIVCATSALAGGGPENVLLVVNPLSHASLTVANHYQHLHHIPPCNVLYLPWEPKREYAAVDNLRRKILIPILRAIDERRLAAQIDYVVYSCDFPWGVNLASDIAKFTEAMKREQPGGKFEWPKQLTEIGSLTGLTYLFQPVLAGHPAYLEMESNWYMPQAAPDKFITPSRGFRSSRQFDRQGDITQSGGRRYLLSTMLGVTEGRGNSLDEVLSYLGRSASADGTQPKGTIYFVKNGDIRSTVRHNQFPAAVKEIKKLGIAAEIIEGTVPIGRSDVQGAMMGTADFDWKASDSSILPGAICEHFTSLGGIMSAGGGQTPLSVFLRYGAAGASGTVTEPYAIPQKFPSAMLQVHYARGCTLAESFYQSVHSPYQLLIVGDPLCRPWAKIPQVTLPGVEENPVVRGKLALKPVATLPDGAAVDHFELFVDGVRTKEFKPTESIDLSTAKLADGRHELRVVAIAAGPIESQGRCILPITVANQGRKIELALATKEPLKADKPIALAANAPGASAILVVQGNRVVARLAGEKGDLEIAPNMLGAGPVELFAVGLGKDGPASNVLSEPISLTIE